MPAGTTAATIGSTRNVQKKEVIPVRVTRALIVGIVVAAAVLALAGSALALTPAGTPIKNRAWLEYSDANGNPLPGKWSNYVTTIVSQVAGVDVAPDSSQRTGNAATDVLFPVSITNTGNGDDYYDITTVNSSGWTVTVYPDGDCSGAADSTTPISSTPALSQGDTYCVVLAVSIPPGASEADQSQTTLTATSSFDSAISDSGVYTVIARTALLECTKSASSTTPKPEEVVTYTILGHNAGSATAYSIEVRDQIPDNTTYVSSSMRFGPAGGGYSLATPLTDADDSEVNPYGVKGNYNSFSDTIIFEYGDCSPVASGAFYFQVEINAGVTATTAIYNYSTTYYENETGDQLGPTNSNQNVIHVAVAADVSISPSSQTTYQDPGDEVAYPLTVCNNSNAPDIIDVELISGQGWSTWELYLDEDGSGTLNAGDILVAGPDYHLTYSTASIAQGACIKLLAVVTVPAGESDGTIDTTTVTATSTNDPTVSDEAKLYTHVTAPNVTVEKSVTPTGSQPPGTLLTYRIDYENLGSGAATAVTITDTIPANTTYQAETVVLNGIPKTDGSGDDEVTVTGGIIEVVVGSLGPTGSGYIEFQVEID